MCPRRLLVVRLPEVLRTLRVVGPLGVLLLLRFLQDVRAVHVRVLPRVRTPDGPSGRSQRRQE